jgi:hypothetical protein
MQYIYLLIYWEKEKNTVKKKTETWLVTSKRVSLVVNSEETT